RERGFLVNAAGPHVVRLVPPLVLTDAQADAFLEALPAALDAATVPGTTSHDEATRATSAARHLGKGE
ncbi:MAG: hypothetical protein ACXVWV_14980, partial [Nocardioides sp.]